MENLKKLHAFEGQDLIVDISGEDLKFPAAEMNCCHVEKRDEKYYIQDEDDGEPVVIKAKTIDYIEMLFTGEGIIHLINNINIRIMLC